LLLLVEVLGCALFGSKALTDVLYPSRNSLNLRIFIAELLHYSSAGADGGGAIAQ
jgi:hypothetical protein